MTIKEPCIWKLLRKFQKLSPDGFPESTDKDSIYRSKVPFTKVQLVDQIEKMETLLGEQSLSNTNVVFSHNDLLLGNILLSNEGPE